MLFVDIRRSLIFKMAPGGDPEVIRENSGGSNGLTFDLQGRLIMCEGDDRRITRMEADGTITPLVELWEGKRLNRPNDVVGRSDGSLYFTDPGMRVDADERELDFAGIYRIAPDGTSAPVITEFEYPNGLAFSPDERILYVAHTRDSTHIQAYDVNAADSTSNPRVFADMSSQETDVLP